MVPENRNVIGPPPVDMFSVSSHLRGKQQNVAPYPINMLYIRSQYFSYLFCPISPLVLNMALNGVTGPIPDAIVKLSQIEFIYLSTSLLTRFLSSTIGAPSRLE